MRRLDATHKVKTMEHTNIVTYKSVHLSATKSLSTEIQLVWQSLHCGPGFVAVE